MGCLFGDYFFGTIESARKPPGTLDLVAAHFLVAPKRLYKSACPSVRPWVCHAFGHAFAFRPTRSDFWPCIRPCFWVWGPRPGQGDIGSSSIIDPSGLAQKCIFLIIASFFERDIFERDIFEKVIFERDVFEKDNFSETTKS